jgi:hypothetical protein
MAGASPAMLNKITVAIHRASDVVKDEQIKSAKRKTEIKINNKPVIEEDKLE